jgi:hypothetical protein
VEWIEALRGSTVGLDTGPLIYYIEEHPIFLAKIKPFFAAAERNEFRIVTSFVTLIEVLVHPLREGRPDLAEEYRNILLQSAALTAIPLDEGIARTLRAPSPQGPLYRMSPRQALTSGDNASTCGGRWGKGVRLRD